MIPKVALVFAVMTAAFYTTTLAFASTLEPERRPRVVLLLENQRSARTRVVVYVNRAQVSQRRMDALSRETVHLNLVAPSDVRVVALDEGFNRYLDEDVWFNAQPGDTLHAAVTAVDLVFLSVPVR